ncbi:MAG: hypothetical protein EBX41_02570 [Chitinophagia bacterium]|nr:hypothetical protein [Chitinophagia bacterium]
MVIATPKTNFEQMMDVVNSVFDYENDRSQLDVTDEVIERILALHPAAAIEKHDANGPTVWILLIPVSKFTMNRFLDKKINEQELFDQTAPGGAFHAIYLCSAVVLPSYRRKGIAMQLTVDAINQITAQHPVAALFYWKMSEEGKMLAEKIAVSVGLPLFERS